MTRKNASIAGTGAEDGADVLEPMHLIRGDGEGFEYRGYNGFDQTSNFRKAGSRYTRIGNSDAHIPIIA